METDRISVSLGVRKIIVRLRMWYADIRGHHGHKWDYEPGEHYLGMQKSKYWQKKSR